MKKRLSNKVARDVFLLEDYQELVSGIGTLLETARKILAAQRAIKQRHTPEAE
jgi:hypothetical protein